MADVSRFCLHRSHQVPEQKYKENKLVKHLQGKKVLDPLALELLGKLLEMDPKKRITAESAVLVRTALDTSRCSLHTAPITARMGFDLPTEDFMVNSDLCSTTTSTPSRGPPSLMSSRSLLLLMSWT